MRDMSETSDTQKDLLSAEDVAGYLGVGSVTVYRWCKEGSLRCIKLGKHWRIRREALEEFLKQRERPAKLSGELRSFLSTLPTHIAIVDSSGTIVAVNQAWQDFATSNGAVVSKVTEAPTTLTFAIQRQEISRSTLPLSQRGYARYFLVSEKSLRWSIRVIRPLSHAGLWDG